MAEGFNDCVINRQATVGVVGLGYVGLPLAVEYGEGGFKVIRVQIAVPGMKGTCGTGNSRTDVSRTDVSITPIEIFEPRPYLRIIPRLFEHLRDKLGWGGQPNYAQSAGAD